MAHDCCENVVEQSITSARPNFGEPQSWHTFRHSYSTLLRANGTDVKVQSELLRHSNIGTTLNLYTQAVSEQKRAAHGQVVKQLLAV